MGILPEGMVGHTIAETRRATDEIAGDVVPTAHVTRIEQVLDHDAYAFTLAFNADVQFELPGQALSSQDWAERIAVATDEAAHELRKIIFARLGIKDPEAEVA